MCPVGVFPGAGAGFFDGNVRKISPKGRTQADSLGILHYLCAFGRNGMDRLSEIREPLEKVFGEYEEFMKRALYSDNRFVAGIMDYIVSSRGRVSGPCWSFSVPVSIPGSESASGPIWPP